MEGHNLRIHHVERFWNRCLLTGEGHGALIKRETVKAGAKFRGKAFKFIECIFFVKDFGIGLQSMGRIEKSRAATSALLGLNCMRRRICTEEEFRGARGS